MIKIDGSGIQFDPGAIHRDVNFEFLTMDYKANLDVDDILCIEDSNEEYTKKRTTVDNIVSTVGTDVMRLTVPNQIVTLPEKTVLNDNDLFMLSNSEDSGLKNYIKYGDLLYGVTEWSEIFDFDSIGSPAGLYTLKLFEVFNSLLEKEYGFLKFDLKIYNLINSQLEITTHEFSLFVPFEVYRNDTSSNNRPFLEVQGETLNPSTVFLVSPDNNELEIFFETFYYPGAKVFIRRYNASAINYKLNDSPIFSGSPPSPYEKKLSLIGNVKSFSNGFNMGSNRIVGCSAPVNTDDVATKNYVDNNAGADNTASNIGTEGEGLYSNKTGVDLEFRNIASGSSKVTAVQSVDTTNVEIDIVPTEITQLGIQTSSLDMGSHLVMNGADPIHAQDLSTKNYVDNNAGADNTASNIGTEGEGLYSNKTGVDLEFRNIASGSSKVTAVQSVDTTNVEIDIVPTEIHQLGVQSSLLDMGSNLIINGIDPISLQDVATKNYVDNNVGADNTASNIGTEGEGLYSNKTGVDLEFRNIASGSSKVTAVQSVDTTNVEIDIVPTEIHQLGIQSHPLNMGFQKIVQLGDPVDNQDATTLSWTQTQLALKQNLLTNNVDNLSTAEVQQLANIHDAIIPYSSWSAISGLKFSIDSQEVMASFMGTGIHHIPLTGVLSSQFFDGGKVFDFLLTASNSGNPPGYNIEVFSVRIILPNSVYGPSGTEVSPIIEYQGSAVNVDNDHNFLHRIVISDEGDADNYSCRIYLVVDGDGSGGNWGIKYNELPGTKSALARYSTLPTPVSGYPVNTRNYIDFNRDSFRSTKTNSGAVKILSNGDSSKPVYSLSTGVPQQIVYTNPVLDAETFFPEVSTVKDSTSIYGDVTSPSVYAGIFFETPVPGQAQQWRVCFSYSKLISAENIGLYIYLVNPVNGFTRKVLTTLPDGEISNNNLVVEICTYADSNSLQFPIGSGAGGYQFFVESVTNSLDVTIEDITRINSAY